MPRCIGGGLSRPGQNPGALGPLRAGRPSPWIYHAASTAAATAGAQHNTVLRPAPVLLWDVDRRPPPWQPGNSIITLYSSCDVWREQGQEAALDPRMR